MNNIQLSICIPTYNREKYLKELLDCILNQLKDIEDNVVEICVSDNASTDNTQSMILEYQQKYNNITYFRWDKNMGADMNYLKVVEIAHGKYCWFFGSDDLMADGAMKRMLEEIKEDCDIYLCNSIKCDRDMNKLYKCSMFHKNVSNNLFFFKTDKDIVHYLKSINLKSVEGLFTYLSVIVVKKQQWNSIEFDKSFIGTAYVHTYILLSLLKKNIILKYINESIVMYRGDNDSFAYDGLANRIKLDFDGYKKLFTTVFSSNKEISNYYKIVLRKYYNYYLISRCFYEMSKKEKIFFIDIVKDIHNMKIIYFFSIIYGIYKVIFKKILKKLNIHQKLLNFMNS